MFERNLRGRTASFLARGDLLRNARLYAGAACVLTALKVTLVPDQKLRAVPPPFPSALSCTGLQTEDAAGASSYWLRYRDGVPNSLRAPARPKLVDQS